ncbi:class I SAM-dependent methyltransferase [Rhodobacteraceae bacterium NNCM2]|nr:class I SAM-dependent methyltransferase [Coraliihabitans acroporae]
MDPVHQQYEAYPYPARDPADEAKRLIEGSPSDPVEVDHFLFNGQRDWSRPFRVLVAGGGTGDALIMLAQRLSDIGCPAEITYLDLSTASRAIAEARAAVRGLSGIRFVTGDLLSAPELGPFDYIDCCGVLHHLPDPDAGFAALAAALAPDGGMGLMVYAPLGRTGVYPLQEAFGTLFEGDAPEDRVAMARSVMAGLPQVHPFARNPLLGDHRDSDAGLYDLLLHSRDRPYTAPELIAALEGAGLGLVSFVEGERYNPLRYLPQDAAFAERVRPLDPAARAGLAERLAGNMKTHIAYVTHRGRGGGVMARPSSPESVPHLKGVAPLALARQVKAKGGVRVGCDGHDFWIALANGTARLIGGINGKATLGDMARQSGLDWIVFLQHWGGVSQALAGFNLLHYSKGARR